MYQDQMKPVERAKALAAGKDVDRMPVDIMYGAPAHALMGWTLQQEMCIRDRARLPRHHFPTQLAGYL